MDNQIQMLLLNLQWLELVETIWWLIAKLQHSGQAAERIHNTLPAPSSGMQDTRDEIGMFRQKPDENRLRGVRSHETGR